MLHLETCYAGTIKPVLNRIGWALEQQIRSRLHSSSSREIRIRVPFFLQSMLVGEPSPQKRNGKRARLGDLDE